MRSQYSVGFPQHILTYFISVNQCPIYKRDKTRKEKKDEVKKLGVICGCELAVAIFCGCDMHVNPVI